MELPTPDKLTLEVRLGLENEIILHDPEHRWHTAEHFGHQDPTAAELFEWWFKGGGATGFRRMLDDIVKQRFASTSA